jgi:hypothetical protein
MAEKAADIPVMELVPEEILTACAISAPVHPAMRWEPLGSSGGSRDSG